MTRLIPATTGKTRAVSPNTRRSLCVTQGPVERYDPYGTPRVSQYADPTPLPDMTTGNGFMHALQVLFVQQALLLREFDLRLKHLEAAQQPVPQNQSFYRATWWMLWGILMLIVGAALTVILFLIFSTLLH